MARNPFDYPPPPDLVAEIAANVFRPRRPYRGRSKAMASEFEVGDVVRLKSGGPKMTIVGGSDADTHGLLCKWFPEEDSSGCGAAGPWESRFPAAALVMAEGVGGKRP
jgi:uncharacterized protein YodC (DUF2158 family)